MADERGSLMDPVSWANAINKISSTAATSTMTILALLALLGYLAFRGVPAIVDLKVAIEHNSDVVTEQQAASNMNQATIISNQQQIIAQHGTMIVQNGQQLDAIQTQQKELSDQNTRILGLEADEKARSAHDALRR